MILREHASKDVSRLLADDYSQKILVSSYASPMSAQRLSKVCRIPIAACYRRIHELEQAGLVTIDREKGVHKGRNARVPSLMQWSACELIAPRETFFGS